jgi:rubrerythrin
MEKGGGKWKLKWKWTTIPEFGAEEGEGLAVSQWFLKAHRAGDSDSEDEIQDEWKMEFEKAEQMLRTKYEDLPLLPDGIHICFRCFRTFSGEHHETECPSCSGTVECLDGNEDCPAFA